LFGHPLDELVVRRTVGVFLAEFIDQLLDAVASPLLRL
jgi:hypothetical protein